MELIARLFRMTEDVWQRHANPWSVWTRLATLPLLLLTLWSFHWIGWYGLLPLLLLAAWIWLNPRVFPPPVHTDSWASKATFGERVYLNRAAVPIPPQHAVMARVLSLSAAIASMVMLAGVALAEPAIAILAAGLAAGAKLWFCDRMVWLYDDMRMAHAPYAAWLRRQADVIGK